MSKSKGLLISYMRVAPSSFRFKQMICSICRFAGQSAVASARAGFVRVQTLSAPIPPVHPFPGPPLPVAGSGSRISAPLRANVSASISSSSRRFKSRSCCVRSALSCFCTSSVCVRALACSACAHAQCAREPVAHLLRLFHWPCAVDEFCAQCGFVVTYRHP